MAHCSNQITIRHNFLIKVWRWDTDPIKVHICNTDPFKVHICDTNQFKNIFFLHLCSKLSPDINCTQLLVRNYSTSHLNPCLLFLNLCSAVFCFWITLALYFHIPKLCFVYLCIVSLLVPFMDPSCASCLLCWCCNPCADTTAVSTQNIHFSYLFTYKQRKNLGHCSNHSMNLAANKQKLGNRLAVYIQ